MPADHALEIAIRVMTPAAVCFVSGFALSLRAAIRSRSASRWGIRLSVLGFCLLHLVPGLVLVFEVATGQLLWPATIAGVVAIALGLVFLAVLRRNWNSRLPDSNQA